MCDPQMSMEQPSSLTDMQLTVHCDVTRYELFCHQIKLSVGDYFLMLSGDTMQGGRVTFPH